MEPRRARMRGVRAPHRRTAHTAHPPIRGCAAGCAVGGANPAPRRTGWVALGWGRGGPLTAASRDSGTGPHRPYPPPLRGCHVIQRERPQPFPACPDPHPPVCGPQRAADGPEGLSWRFGPSLRFERRRGPTPTLAYPAPTRRLRSCWSCPLRGSGAAAPIGALRAIDPSARPRLGRTAGPRRLRRQSESDLVATHGGAT
jgi:hypothetical protein